MRKLTRFLIPIAFILFLSPAESLAMMHGKGGHMGPYGGYCKGPRWGWYGAGRQIRTVEDARELVTEFLQNTELSVGEIRDMETYYEVDVINQEDEVVDFLILDKRTCRIRSAY